MIFYKGFTAGISEMTNKSNVTFSVESFWNTSSIQMYVYQQFADLKKLRKFMTYLFSELSPK